MTLLAAAVPSALGGLMCWVSREVIQWLPLPARATDFSSNTISSFDHY